MPWIEQVPIDKATGLLKKLFDEAIKHAGRVYNIVHVRSLNPVTLEAGRRLYGTVMHGRSPLTRIQREMLATVVSVELGCLY